MVHLRASVHYKTKSFGFIFLIFLQSIISCSDKKYSQINPETNEKEEYFLNSEGKKHGAYFSFYANAVLKEESMYKNGLFIRERKLFRTDGSLEIKENYDDKGLLNGQYVVYHQNGKPALEKYYVDNKVQGLLTTYFPSGKIKEKVQMKDNLENGPFEEYFENGSLHWKGTFLNGDQEVGELIEFDSLGNKIKIMDCDSFGVCVTKWRK